MTGPPLIRARRRTAALVLVAATALAGCGDSEGETTTGPGDDAGDALAGTEWVLDADASTIDASAATTDVLLTFDDDGGYGASVGCNSIGGTYTLDGTTLELGAGAMTEMGCPPGIAELELAYVAALATVTEAEVGDAALTLTGGDGTELVYGPRDPVPPTTAEALVGDWEVVSIASGDAVSSVTGEPTISFAADGTFTLSPGCNSGSGRYEIGDGTLRVTETMLTASACLDADDQAQEVAIVEGLQSTRRFEVTRGGIDLLDGSGSLLLQLAAAA